MDKAPGGSLSRSNKDSKDWFEDKDPPTYNMRGRRRGGLRSLRLKLLNGTVRMALRAVRVPSVICDNNELSGRKNNDEQEFLSGWVLDSACGSRFCTMGGNGRLTDAKDPVPSHGRQVLRIVEDNKNDE